MEKTKFGLFYDKYYIALLLIPVVLVIASLFYLGNFYSVNGDFIYKDISLAGGTTVTISEKSVLNDLDLSESLLKAAIPDVGFKRLSDLSTNTDLALVVESSLDPDVLKPLVEDALGIVLTSDNSSTEFNGPSISSSFYSELLKVILLSFILMGLVVFIIFGESKFVKSLCVFLSLSAVRLTFPASGFLFGFVILIGAAAIIYSLINIRKEKNINKIFFGLSALLFLSSLFYPLYFMVFVSLLLLLIIYSINSGPSIAVVFAAFSNLVFVTVVVDLMGVKLSSAGLVAFLMIIGYSVDTDILLTNRVLRSREGTVNHRIKGAFNTGLFMTITALASVLPAFLLVTGLPDSFRQIFLVISIGLFADIINTWLTNAGIIKLYCKRKGIN